MPNGNKFALSNASFDPENIIFLRGAFEDAWLKI